MDFGPKEIGRILELTDSLGLHREAVMIPLAPEGSGVVRIEGGRLVIHRPEEGDFDEWFATLPASIESLDTSHLKRANC
ncbi:MAG: hypothetical protein ABFS86_02130 [Planctomycetota bacterium]